MAIMRLCLSSRLNASLLSRARNCRWSGSPASSTTLGDRWSALAIQSGITKSTRAHAMELVHETIEDETQRKASDGREGLLDRQETAAVVWRVIARNRVPEKVYRPLVETQMQKLRDGKCGHLCQPGKLTKMELRITAEPYFAALHILCMLRPSINESGALQLQDTISECNTLVSVAQAIRRWQRELQTGEHGKRPNGVPYLNASDGTIGEPVALLGPAAMDHIWSVAATDALELRIPANSSLGVLDWVSYRTSLRHKRLVPYTVQFRIAHKRALSYGLFGAWGTALSLVQGLGPLPREFVESHKNFVECCTIRMAWQNGKRDATAGLLPASWNSEAQRTASLDSVNSCIRFAPSWEDASRVACAWICQQVDGGAASFLLGDALCSRPDVSWVNAIRMCCLAHVDQESTTRLLNRVVTILAEKTPFPFSPQAAFDISCAAASSRVAEPLDAFSNSMLYKDGRIALAQGVSLMSRGRWDIAVGLLCAAAHYDTAVPISRYLREIPTIQESAASTSAKKNLFPLPLPLNAFVGSRGAHGIPQPPTMPHSMESLLCYDAHVLAVFLTQPSHVANTYILSTGEAMASTPPLVPVVHTQFVSPRTRSLISSLRYARNPFTGLFSACYLYQSVVKTSAVLHTALESDRVAFQDWVAEQSKVRSTAQLFWHPIANHLMVRRYVKANIPSSSPVTTGSVLSKSVNAIEARRLLRQVLRCSDPATAAVKNVEDWHGLLVLIAVSRRGNSGSRAVSCEHVLLKCLAKLHASGNVAASGGFPPLARDLGILTTLAAVDAADVTVATVSSIADMWPAAELKKYPIAASLAGYVLGLAGRWESALELFDPTCPPLDTTRSGGRGSYGSLVAALCRQLPRCNIPHHWAIRWLECAMTVPNQDVAILLSRHVRSLYNDAATAAGPFNSTQKTPPNGAPLSDINSLMKLTKAMWSRNRSSPTGDEIVRLLRLGDDVCSRNGKLTTDEGMRLSAALCLVASRPQLLSIAAAVGRPLAAEELRPVACCRVLSILPWETALTFFADAASCWKVGEQSLISILGRSTVPDAALKLVVHFAAVRCMTAAAALASGILLLRGGDVHRGVTHVSQCLRILLRLYKHSGSMMGGASVVLLLARSVVAAALQNDDSVATSHAALNDVCRALCEQNAPQWIVAWRRIVINMKVDHGRASAPVTHIDGSQAVEAVLMTVFVALNLARASMYPVGPSLASGALNLACDAGQWAASLYFFSQIRHPRPTECVHLALSLRAAPWVVSLRVLSHHRRLLDARPDVKCAALLCAMTVAQRSVEMFAGSTIPSDDDVWTAADQMPNNVWLAAVLILQHPCNLNDRFKDLSHVLGTAAKMRENRNDNPQHRRASSICDALVESFDSPHAVWRTACSLVVHSWASSSPSLVSESLDVSRCIVEPIERAKASAVAKRLLDLADGNTKKLLGESNEARLEWVVREEELGLHDDD